MDKTGRAAVEQAHAQFGKPDAEPALSPEETGKREIKRIQRRMKRPNGYPFAVEWIAMNDNPGGVDEMLSTMYATGGYTWNEIVNEVAGYISTLLVADIFKRPARVVASAVVAFRQEYNTRKRS